MILLNFSHPITAEQVAQVEAQAGQEVEQVMTLAVQFDNEEAFLPQLQGLLTHLGLTPEELQTKAILINLPSLNIITGLLLAELHGRMGYFPPVLRLRPVPGVTPLRFEVAEIINLQTVRNEARKER